ncbi:MAG: NAD-dependent epimerase/dehydratase family protein [Breznakibacter sp.]
MSLSKKILVTGATGLVGSHLLHKLMAEGHQVKAMYRSHEQITKWAGLMRFYGDGTMPGAKPIEWIKGDVTDYYSILDALDGTSKVYHCAAMVSFDPHDKEQMFLVNQEGTANVVNACIESGIEKLCHVSSIGALGSPVNGHFIDEETAWQNDDDHSAYSWSKFMAEMEVWRGTKEGMPTVIVNPAVILGPGDVTKSSGAIWGLSQKGLKYYTNGITGFVDVRDVVNAMYALMESDCKDERFVLVSENLSYRNLFTNMAGAFGSVPPYIYASKPMTELAWRLDWLLNALFAKKISLTRENARTSHSVSYYSSKKIINRFGITFRPIKDTLKETADWIKTSQPFKN